MELSTLVKVIKQGYMCCISLILKECALLSLRTVPSAQMISHFSTHEIEK